MRRKTLLLVALTAAFFVTPACGGGGEASSYPPHLHSITLGPENPGVILQDQQVLTFTATGHYHDAYGQGLQWTEDLTATAVWTSSNPQCATFTSAGTVACHAYGATRVVVSFDGSSAQTTLTVTTPIRISRTGQTTSHASGDDGDVQSGVAWPAPRLVKHGDGTVTDGLTGLMWLDDANSLETHYPNAAINHRDGQVSTYNDAKAFVAGINDGTYTVANVVYNDWRLPSVVELESLCNLGAVNNAVWLESQGFVNVDVGSPYHMSASRAGSDQFAVNMRNGLVYHWTGIGFIWPVRTATDPHAAQAGLASPVPLWTKGTGPEPGTVGWPNPRFEVGTGNRVGTVYDRMTGLTWVQAPPAADMTWQDAITYANGLNLGGFSDWRIPNRKEARSLLFYGLQASFNLMWLAEQGFTTPSSFLWTSTSWAPNPLSAWTVSIGHFSGFDHTQTFNKSLTQAVWPVRGP